MGLQVGLCGEEGSPSIIERQMSKEKLITPIIRWDVFICHISKPEWPPPFWYPKVGGGLEESTT